MSDPGTPSGTPDDPPEANATEVVTDDNGDETERGAANVMEELGEGFNEAIAGHDAGPARPD